MGAERIKQERVAAYAARKEKKPALIAKSNIILDVKPWDDETDMKEVEAQVLRLKLMVFSGALPNWCHWPMESRNYRFPLLLKMTRFLLTGLWKLSRKLKTWSRVLILLLSTRSKLNLHYSCVASVPVWMQQIKTRYEREKKKKKKKKKKYSALIP